jgi:hypothetical protein
MSRAQLQPQVRGTLYFSTRAEVNKTVPRRGFAPPLELNGLQRQLQHLATRRRVGCTRCAA